MQPLLQGQMGTAWGAQKGRAVGISLTRAALTTRSPQYKVPAVAVILCYSRDKPFALHLATWRRKLDSTPPSQVFPFHLTSIPQLLSFVLHGAASQADFFFFKWVSEVLLCLFKALMYLGCNSFACRGLFLYIHLYSAQFHKTLILTGGFLKPCHTSNSKSMKVQTRPAQTSNTACVRALWDSRKRRAKSGSWDICNWTKLISFRLQLILTLANHSKSK